MSVPTITPSTTPAKPATRSAVTPDPTRSLAPGIAALTRWISARSAGRPVAGPDTISASAMARYRRLAAASSILSPGGGVACLTNTSASTSISGPIEAFNPGEVSGLPLYEPLIRVHGAREDVDADEPSLARRGNRQRGDGIVAQDIDADRQIDRVPDRRRHPRQGCHGGIRDIVGKVGNVAVVLHQDGVEARVLQGGRIVYRSPDHPSHRRPVSGGTREGPHVDHPDELEGCHQ